MFPKRTPIDEIFEQMEREFLATMEAAGTNRVAEGRRVENVDGEIKEYRLEDGEWVEVNDSDDVAIGISDGEDEPLRATIDLSTRIGDSPKAVASASFNNGILDVEFEYESNE